MDLGLLFFVALGVAISVALPLLRQRLPSPPDVRSATGPSTATRVWGFVKPYVIVGLFSLLVAVLVLAFLGDQVATWQSAVLAGYTSDATLQRLALPQGASPT